MNVTQQPTVTSALVKSVHAMDSSRRVGWAKAFAAAEQAEEAHRIAALTAGDRDAYRWGASFLWGVLMEWTNGLDAPEVRDHLIDNIGELAFILDTSAVSTGRRRGRRLADAFSLLVERSQAKVESKRASDALDRAFGRGQRYRLAKLARLSLIHI